jgi:hypothetical protein
VFVDCLVPPKLGIGVPARVGNVVVWYTDVVLMPDRRRPPTGASDVSPVIRQQVLSVDEMNAHNGMTLLVVANGFLLLPYLYSFVRGRCSFLRYQCDDSG